MLSFGLMTGTSIDAVDIAAIQTDGKNYIERLDGVSLDFPKNMKIALRKLQEDSKHIIGDLGLTIESIDYAKGLIDDFTNLNIKACKILSEKLGKLPDVIGFHGQNIYHNPQQKISLQIGDAQKMANSLNVKVVGDFRSQDVRGGGQGAPLAPIYHKAILSTLKFPRPIAIINCGGISNITIIPSVSDQDLIGFDTGPGNVLIDRYMRKNTNLFMDKNGEYGSKGTANPRIIEELFSHSISTFNGSNYFEMPPPKSLDTYQFHLPKSINELSIEDACATLEEFTAHSIVNALKLVNHSSPKTVILAGGGWKNPVIKNKFIELLKTQETQILDADEAGLSNQFMEAEIFAYLAVRRLHNLPISFPYTTGVKKDTLSGEVFFKNRV